MAEISGVQPTNVIPRNNNQNINQQLRTDVSGLRNANTGQVVVDPSRVVRTNGQEVNTGDEAYKYGQDSNFESFVRNLRSMPEMGDIYNDVFMAKLTSSVNLATYSEEFAEKVYAYMQAINMSPDQMLQLLKEQNSMTSKFSGPFFDIIRNMMQNGSSRELTMAVLDFLKRYDALTSNDHTENVMLSNLKSIAANIPKSRADQLLALLQEYPQGGSHEEKLNFMKNDMMPMLTKYVSQTHDYGVARDMIAMFTVSLAKFETGSEGGFIESFRNLSGYLQLMGMLDGVDAAALQDRLMSGNENSAMNTNLVNTFISILQDGLGGAAGAANKASFQEMISGLLMNESVYMPVTHLVLPANIDGKMLFSEMWIDPDAEGNGAGGSGDKQKASKIYVKFMIKELGNFDLMLLEKDGKVNLELHYPETINERSADIRKDISAIVRSNDLSVDNIMVAKGRSEKNLMQIFPKIFANKTSVDVSV